jgi:hypothetical protein
MKRSSQPSALRSPTLEGKLAGIPVQRIAEHKAAGRAHQVTLFLMLLIFQIFLVRAGCFVHVGMHVGHEKILSAVVVEIEELNSHRAPGCPGEVLRGFFDE